MARKAGLGQGLDALMDDNALDSFPKQTVRVSSIEPNKSQPRRDFDEASIAALADSIREHGLIQPLLVRPYNGGYQLVAGERRWRACRMLGMDEVQVVIRELSDEETAQIALIENLQREDLNPIEVAMGYKDLMDRYSMTQENVAKTVGKSRSSVANMLRMLSLPDEVLDMIRGGQLSAGHAKALGSFEDSAVMLETAKKAATGQLTVRDVEKLASKKTEKEPKSEKPELPKSYYTEMELGLREALRRKVKITVGENRGTLSIEFYDDDDLADIARKLTE